MWFSGTQYALAAYSIPSLDEGVEYMWDDREMHRRVASWSWHVFVLSRIIDSWYLDMLAEFGTHFCEQLFLPTNETDARHSS